MTLPGVLSVLTLLSLFSRCNSSPPTTGPYSVNASFYTIKALDSTDPQAWLWYPTNSTFGEKFPLVPYLHGMAGGNIDILLYSALFSQMASYGFIVAGTLSCFIGCNDTHSPANRRWTACGGLPPLPPTGWGWDGYYAEAFKIIDFARNSSNNGEPVFSLIDFDAGVGIVGHSMGGQGAAQASTGSCPETWGVKTAVLHHPAKGDIPSGNIGANVTVPLFGMTSSGDSIAYETRDYMAAFNHSSQGGRVPSAYREASGWSHLEPMLWPPDIENPLLATYTAAWLKVFLNKDRGVYYDLIFGTGPDSLCQSENMTACYVVSAPPQ